MRWAQRSPRTPVDADALYGALDWLLRRQGAIEKQLARRHFADGSLVRYAIASTCGEGRCRPHLRGTPAGRAGLDQRPVHLGLERDAAACSVR